MLLAAATARTATRTAFEQLCAIIAQLPGLIAVTRGPQHVIVFANPAFARAAGCCEEDLVGRSAGAVLAELGSPGDGERLDQVYQTDTPSPVMEWCGSLDREGDGMSRGAIWRAVLRPMRTATGAVSGVLIHATDITGWVQVRRGFEEFMSGDFAHRTEEWLPAHTWGPSEASHGPCAAAAGAAGRGVAAGAAGRGVAAGAAGRGVAAGGGGAAGEPVGQIATDGPSVSVVERRRAARRRVDEERAWLLTQAQEALAQAREAQCRVAFLADASRLLASSLDYETTLATITALAVPRLADWCSFAIIDVDGSIHHRAVAPGDAARVEALQELERHFPLDPAARMGVAQVLRTGQALLYPEIPDALLEESACNPEHLELLRRLRFRSVLEVPLVAAGHTLGVLILATAESGRRYGPADLAMAADLARHAALALDQARLYRASQQARDAAEAAVQARDEFLSSATHDLRVPLTTTMGRAHMVQRRLLARDARDAIDQTWLSRQMEALCDASKRMLAAVNEMNDVAGLQMGHALDLHREPVDVGMVLYIVADDAGTQHGRRVVDVEAPIGAVVLGDRARLERVMHNIVGNAIKYSAGRTPVRVEVSQDDAWVTVTVRDRGVGIPADEVPHVFTHFYRASTAIGVPGSGIGLAGARTIVEQHGGHITLQSALGAGTTVTITLPRAGRWPDVRR